jgi:hypothetical protein
MELRNLLDNSVPADEKKKIAPAKDSVPNFTLIQRDRILSLEAELEKITKLYDLEKKCSEVYSKFYHEYKSRMTEDK